LEVIKISFFELSQLKVNLLINDEYYKYYLSFGSYLYCKDGWIKYDLDRVTLETLPLSTILFDSEKEASLLRQQIYLLQNKEPLMVNNTSKILYSQGNLRITDLNYIPYCYACHRIVVLNYNEDKIIKPCYYYEDRTKNIIYFFHKKCKRDWILNHPQGAKENV